MSVRRLTPTTRKWLVVALVAWVLLLVVTMLAASSAGPTWMIETTAAIGKQIGLPDALTSTERVEFGLNVAAFAPVGLLGSLLWPRPSWRDWTAGGFVASFLVETVQALALPERTATHSDVVANTLGALVGAVLGSLLVGDDRGASEDGADLPDRVSPTEQDQLPG